MINFLSVLIKDNSKKAKTGSFCGQW